MDAVAESVPGVAAAAVRKADEAMCVVKKWSAEDRRNFTNFMCGYSATAVLAFDERRMALRGPRRRSAGGR